MSSGWFDWTEPSLTTSLQGIEGRQGAKCTSWMRFKHIEPHRTFSNCILIEIARYIDFFHSSSGWFDCTEPSQTTSLQGIQGVQGAICTGSGRFKHIEPHRTSSNLLELHTHRDSKVYRLISQEFGVVRLDRTFSDCIFTGDRRSEGALCTSWMRFKHIEPHQTVSNYIRLDRTFSDYSFTGDRSAICTSSRRFKHIEHYRTLANCILTEIAR